MVVLMLIMASTILLLFCDNDPADTYFFMILWDCVVLRFLHSFTFVFLEIWRTLLLIQVSCGMISQTKQWNLYLTQSEFASIGFYHCGGDWFTLYVPVSSNQSCNIITLQYLLTSFDFQWVSGLRFWVTYNRSRLSQSVSWCVACVAN